MTAHVSVDYILKAAKFVSRLAYLIAAIGAATSFGTQVGLLQSWHTGMASAVGIAATVDILAVCAAIALQIPGFPDRGLVGTVLFITLTVSITANMVAGFRDSTGAGLGHAWPVMAYMMAELIASRVRRYAASVSARREAERNAQQVESEPLPVHATASVGTPKAVTATVKPGTAKARILALAAATPPPSHEEIASKVGSTKGWVKHVINTSSTS